MKKVFFALFCLFILSYEAQAQNEMMLNIAQSQSQTQNQTTLNVAQSHEVQTQNDTVLSITQILEGDVPLLDVCKNKYDRAIIYPAEGCSSFYWSIYGVPYYENQPLILDKNDSYYHFGGIYVFCGVNYIGCGMNSSFTIRWFDTTVPNETTDETWIHGGELAELQAVGNDSVDMYSYHWDTGETENVIYKPGGTYVCGISDLCATSYRTKIVKESVEIYRAGIDLATGYNKLTWHVSPAMLNVYDQVKVIWKGSQIAGYAPYASGEFIHEGQGSDIQSWNYRLVGITYDGTECPIESYMIGTPHANFYPINNDTRLKIDWTSPFIEEGAPLSINHIEVYKYQPSSQEIVVVSDYVEPNAEEVSFPIESFNNGQAVLGFIFDDRRDGRDSEEISYTNLSEYFDIDGVAENGESAFEVYPNPSNGTFTVQGAKTLSISNVLGRVITESYSEEEMHHLSMEYLSPGVYFISDGVITKKLIITR